MKDSLGDLVQRKGAAAAAAVRIFDIDVSLIELIDVRFVFQFFIFVAMIGILVDFTLRLIRSKPRV